MKPITALPPITQLIPTPRTEREQGLVNGAINLTSLGKELIGYVVVGVFADGTSCSKVHYPSEEENKIGAQLFEAWIDRELKANIAYGLVGATINEAFEGE